MGIFLHTEVIGEGGAMDQAGIILERIIMLSLLGLVGYIAGKTNYLPFEAGRVLSGIVVKVTTPVLIFTTLTHYHFGADVIRDGALIYIFALIIILVAYIVSSIITRWLKLAGPTANIFKMQAMFGNVIFLAFPLLTALYGEKGVVYALFYNLANDSLLWTLGIALVYEGNGSSWRERLKHLVNGNTLAFAGGIIWVIFGIKDRLVVMPAVQAVYNFLYGTFHPLGVTTIYLSMLFIGLMLSKNRFGRMKDAAKMAPLIILSLIKLLVLPGLALVLLMGTGKILGDFSRSILVLQVAMPAATIVPALAAEAGSDLKFATEVVFTTTVMSIITLPLVVLFI